MNTAFSPTTLAVAGGTQVTITFMNQDGIEHSLTFDDNSQSVEADGGSTKTLTFTTPASGSIPFHCKYHPTQMRGTITVGGSAGSGSSSAGSMPGSSEGSSSSSSSTGY